MAATNGNLSQSYQASSAMWDNTVLPATPPDSGHRWTRLTLTTARQDGTCLLYTSDAADE